MKRFAFLILLSLGFMLCFAKETPEKGTIVSGGDFYFASLAYKDYSSQRRIIFKQDEERVDAFIQHLKSIRDNYDIPIPPEELGKLSRDDRYDYFILEGFVSVSEEEFREKAFNDINDYKFRITYGKKKVEVYMYIDNPSVRDGDVKYIFDYDGNLISRQLGG